MYAQLSRAALSVALLLVTLSLLVVRKHGY